MKPNNEITPELQENSEFFGGEFLDARYFAGKQDTWSRILGITKSGGRNSDYD